MTDFTGAVSPGLDDFRELARGRRVIPVVRRLLADGITAVGLFEVLCGDRAGTFLLESAEKSAKASGEAARFCQGSATCSWLSDKAAMSWGWITPRR